MLRRPAGILPATAVLELTFACNHRCTFCSCPWDAAGASWARRERPTAWWQALCTRLVGLGVTDLCFTGGEPLLKEGLLELVAHAAGLEAVHVETVDGGLVERRAPPRLYLLSNGSAMSEAVLEACARHGVALSMSLPGLATFSWHTGGADPGRVLGWFRQARARGVTLTAGITVTRRNRHELADTVGIALVEGADRVLINRFLPGGRGLDHRDLELAPVEVVEAFDTVEGVLRQAQRRGNVGTEVPRCWVDPARYRQLEVGTGCAAARSFCVVGPDGWVRVCNHSPVRLCDADRIGAVAEHPRWRRFMVGDWQPAACAGCREAGACAAGCRESAFIQCGDEAAGEPGLPPCPERLRG